MILGIGVDLVNIDRIKKILERHGDRFSTRIFSASEQEKASSHYNNAAIYAKRWAAKEACLKALGTGLRMGICWKNMVVANLRSGQPTMTLSGRAKIQLDKLTPSDHTSKIHLSLSDDYPWAQAFIIIEANNNKY